MQRKVYLLNCTGIKAFCEQEGRMEELFLKVDDARRKKAEKIRDFGTACMSLAAGLLLQKVLEEYHAGLAPEGEGAGDFPALFAEITEPIQVKYRTARGGKPYFAKLRLYFNLSHSGDYCMCAVSDEEIGVDIQQQRPAEERKLAKRFFAEQELARVAVSGRILKGAVMQMGKPGGKFFPALVMHALRGIDIIVLRPL